MGFNALNIKFTHQDLGKEEHTILLGNVQKILCGSNVNPKIWKMMYSDLLTYLGHNHSFQITPIENLRVSIYRSLNPFTKALSISAANKKI
jgi:hypothetical protein